MSVHPSVYDLVQCTPYRVLVLKLKTKSPSQQYFERSDFLYIFIIPAQLL